MFPSLFSCILVEWNHIDVVVVDGGQRKVINIGVAYHAGEKAITNVTGQTSISIGKEDAIMHFYMTRECVKKTGSNTIGRKDVIVGKKEKWSVVKRVGNG